MVFETPPCYGSDAYTCELSKRRGIPLAVHVYVVLYATSWRSNGRVAKHTRRGGPCKWRIPQSACKVIRREVDRFMRHHHGFVAYTCKLPKGSRIPHAILVKFIDIWFAVQSKILPICGKIPCEMFKPAFKQLGSYFPFNKRETCLQLLVFVCTKQISK